MRIKTVGQGNHFEATITLALAQNGVTCMPQSLACDYADRFAIVPFSDLDKSMEYVLAWKRENASTALSEFVALPSRPLPKRGIGTDREHGEYPAENGRPRLPPREP